MSANNPSVHLDPLSIHGPSGFSYSPYIMDPLEDIAPSSVAMVILFGSLTFATVGMATRTLLLGDNRAILAAMTVKIKSHTPDNSNTNSTNAQKIASSGNSVMGRSIALNATSSGSVVSEIKDSVWADDEDATGHGGNNNRNVTFSKSAYSTSRNLGTNWENFTKMEALPRPWEPNFVSTFVLFYQATCFGVILFIIYLLDKHPPNSGSGSLVLGKTNNAWGVATQMGVSEFDEDQFLFWTLLVLCYGYFVSWRRNDGKPNEFNSHPSRRLLSRPRDDATVTSRSTKSGDGSRRRKGGLGGSSVGSRSRASMADSSQGSDASRRLEDVLLDDEVDKEVLDTIEDTANNEDGDNESCFKNGSKQACFNLSGGGKSNVIVDVKPDEDVLNRFQTLEWKGFLSIVLLIFQYNNAGVHLVSSSNDVFGSDGLADERGSQIIDANIYDSVYKAAMSSLIFLTGFNHTSYFYFHPANSKSSWSGALPPHYEISRMLDILFRINWAALFLCLILGNSLLLYVACPLHSYFFLVIFWTLRWWHSFNYSKYLFRFKLFMLAIVIFINWDCDFGLDKILSFPLTLIGLNVEAIGGATGFCWEWYYHSYIHHWAAFIGMIYAINQPIVSLQLRKLEALGKVSCFLAKSLMCVTLCLAVTSWVVGPLQMTNAYFGVIPFLAYVYLRNISDTLRERHVGTFSWLGKYSLEIYLLHHHVFAGGSTLVVVTGFPRCNFVVVTLMLLLTARAMHNLTAIMREMLLPEKESTKCIQHASAICVGVLSLYILARVLCWADMVTVGTIATITIICGILLYQTIMDVTWADYRASGLKHVKHPQSSSKSAVSINADVGESSAAKVSPPLIGTFFIFLFGLGWHVWALSNGSSPNTPLSMACGAFVNDGMWVPIQVCSVFEKGKLNREYESMAFFGPSGCSHLIPTTQWAWPKNSHHCGFRYRSDIEVQRKLNGKRVILIGDSSVRSLFYSLCRFMGDYDAGGYDGSHSDTTKTFGSTILEYKWAPLSVDVVTKIKNLKNSAGAFPGSKPRPDLVLAGGGAWDKLHVSVTDEDQQSQREIVTRLAAELRSLRELGMPTVWFTPPSINTRALNSDEKRNQMSEESIEDMRRLYAERGVESSVSFVLDGPSFSHERVTESFDGVHYPGDVYDAGAQILFNALDWLIDGQITAVDDSFLSRPVSPGNPFLGMMMLCFALIGLFFFDGYFGIGYLPQFFVGQNTVSPSELYQDAFDPILLRLKLNENGREPGEATDKSVDAQELLSFLGRSSTGSLSRRR